MHGGPAHRAGLKVEADGMPRPRHHCPCCSWCQHLICLMHLKTMQRGPLPSAASEMLPASQDKQKIHPSAPEPRADGRTCSGQEPGSEGPGTRGGGRSDTFPASLMADAAIGVSERRQVAQSR